MLRSLVYHPAIINSFPETRSSLSQQNKSKNPHASLNQSFNKSEASRVSSTTRLGKIGKEACGEPIIGKIGWSQRCTWNNEGHVCISVVFLHTSKLQEVKKKRAEQVLLLQKKCATSPDSFDEVFKKAEECGLFVILLHIVTDSCHQVRKFLCSIYPPRARGCPKSCCPSL